MENLPGSITNLPTETPLKSMGMDSISAIKIKSDVRTKLKVGCYIDLFLLI